ncbi:hypothetical protein [Muninn virus]|nr:hypothetical protein [Muninn virus]
MLFIISQPSLQSTELTFTNQYAYDYKPNQYSGGIKFLTPGFDYYFWNGSRFFYVHGNTFDFEYKAPGVQYSVGDDTFLGWTAVEASGRDDINTGNEAYYGSKCLQINLYATGGYVNKTDFTDNDGNIYFNMVFKLSGWGDGAGSYMVFSLLGINGVQIATWRLATTANGAANLDWYTTSYTTLRSLWENQWITLSVELNRATNEATIRVGLIEQQLYTFTKNLRNPTETGFSGLKFDWTKGADNGGIIYIDSFYFKRLNRDDSLPCNGISNDWHYYILRAPGSVNFSTYKFMKHKIIANNSYSWASYICSGDYNYNNLYLLTLIRDRTFTKDYINAYLAGLTTTMTPRLVIFFNDSFIIDSWKMYYVKLGSTAANVVFQEVDKYTYATATSDGGLNVYANFDSSLREYITLTFDIPNIAMPNNYTMFKAYTLGAANSTLKLDLVGDLDPSVSFTPYNTYYNIPLKDKTLDKIIIVVDDNGKISKGYGDCYVSSITITPIALTNFITTDLMSLIASVLVVFIPSIIIGLALDNGKIFVFSIPVFTIIAYVCGLVPLWLLVMVIISIGIYVLAGKLKVILYG